MDYSQRMPLFNRHGAVESTGWAKEDIFIYNKENLPGRSVLGEWEIYRLLGEDFSFRAAYGHDGPFGRVSAVLTDYDTGENFRMEKVLKNSGDNLELDFTGDDEHTLKYEDEDFLFLIDFSNGIRRLRFRSEDLDAELSAHNSGEALATLQAYRKNQFRYGFHRAFEDLAGYIHLHNREYVPDTDSFLQLESFRTIAPKRIQRIRGGGAMECEDGLLGFCFTYDSADPDGPSENCFFYGDRVLKLGRVYAKMRLENLMAPWHIYDDADRLHLDFVPLAEDVPASRIPLGGLKPKCGRVYGNAEGTIVLEDNCRIQIQGMRCYGEYSLGD